MFRLSAGRAMLVAAFAAALLLAAARAGAQDVRRQTTETMRQLEVKIEKASSADERRDIEDHIERCRHELGDRDADGKPISWSVGYHLSLVSRLDAEIKEAEGISKGAWGLLSPADDTRRAWRIMARALLVRCTAEQDENERNRYAMAGMLLVHNADVLDATLGSLAAIEQARREVPDGDEHAARRAALDSGLGANRGMITMCKRVQAGEVQMGQGELRSLASYFRRVRASADSIASPPPAADDSGAKAAQEMIQKADALAERVKRLPQAGEALKTTLGQYLEMVRFGAGEEQARGSAGELLGYLERAVGLREAVAQSTIAPDNYRTSRLKLIDDAVARIGRRESRDEGYRDVRDLEQRDRPRRRLEELAMLPRGSREQLMRGYEWADGVTHTPGDDDAHRTAWMIRGHVERLSWKLEQLLAAPKPADRYLGGAVRAGLKDLDKRILQAAPMIADHRNEADGAAWNAVSGIDQINEIRRLDDLIARLDKLSPVNDAIRKACGVLALQLYDEDSSDDGALRNRLRQTRDAAGLLIELHEASLPREDTALAAEKTHNRYFPAYRAQASRDMLALKQVLDGNREEFDVLRTTLPAYRLMAERAILHKAAGDGRIDRCRAARWITVAPPSIGPTLAAADEKLLNLFADLARAKRDELSRIIDPVRSAESICRVVAVSLLELERRDNPPDRLGDVVDNLIRTSLGDPGWEPRERWRVNWHLNQAFEAYKNKMPRTGDWHLDRMLQNNPLLNVSLSTRDKGS